MKTTIVVMLSIVAMVLVACGGEATAVTGATASGPQTIELAPVLSGAGSSEASGDAVALSAGYPDALSIRSQLALGTVELEETADAVTVEQAEQLVPLWQALNSLETSGTAAEAEINAVVNQIQATMTSDQLAAISAMELTAESLEGLAGGRGFAAGRPAGVEGDDGGFAGGPPGGGGIPGGGPGGGGGPGPGGGQELDADALATRQAEFAGGDSADFAERMSSNLVLRLLQTRTGEAPAFQAGGFGGFDAAMSAVAEATGLSMEELGEEMAAGKTLSAIVAEHDGDIDSVRAVMLEALVQSETAGEQDFATIVDDLLNSDFSGRSAARGPAQDQPAP